MRLRPNEFCPVHRSLSYCGRELVAKPKLIRLGVQRVEDLHHPRGYRELRCAPLSSVLVGTPEKHEWFGSFRRGDIFTKKSTDRLAVQ